jgi:hypothetical protein
LRLAVVVAVLALSVLGVAFPLPIAVGLGALILAGVVFRLRRRGWSRGSLAALLGAVAFGGAVTWLRVNHPALALGIVAAVTGAAVAFVATTWLRSVERPL